MSGGTGKELFKTELELVNEATDKIEKHPGGFRDIALNAQSIARDVEAAAIELARVNSFDIGKRMSNLEHDPATNGTAAQAHWVSLDQHVQDLCMQSLEISYVVQGNSRKGDVFPDEAGIKKIVKAHGGASTDEYAQVMKAIMGTAHTVLDVSSMHNGSLVDRLILRHSVGQLAAGSEDVANRKAELPYSYYNGDSILDLDSSWAGTCDGARYEATTNAAAQGWGSAAYTTNNTFGQRPTLKTETKDQVVRKIPDLKWLYAEGNVAGKNYPSVWRKSVEWIQPYLADGSGYNTDGTAYSTTTENVVGRFRYWLSHFDQKYLHVVGCEVKDRSATGCWIHQPSGFTDNTHAFFYEWFKQTFGIHTSAFIGPKDKTFEHAQGYKSDFIKDASGNSAGTVPKWQKYLNDSNYRQSLGGSTRVNGAWGYFMEASLREAWAAHVAAGDAGHTMDEGRFTTIKALLDTWGSDFNGESDPAKWGPQGSQYYADPRIDGALDHVGYYSHSNSPFTLLFEKGNLWNATTLGATLINWGYESMRNTFDVAGAKTHIQYSTANPLTAKDTAYDDAGLSAIARVTKKLTAKQYVEKFYPAYWGLIQELKKLRQKIYELYKLNATMVAAMLLLEVATKNEGATEGLNNEEKEALAAALIVLEALEGGDFTVGSTGFNKRMKFKEQCYLLANIFSFADDSTARTRVWPCEKANGIPGSHLIKLDSDESFGYLNRLVATGEESAYYEMTPADLSTLQPKIQLYKVVYKKTKNQEYEVPMRFETSTTLPSDVLTARKTRGVGCGIKSFDFTYDGSNPFAAKKSIKAQLKIHAANFEELVRPRSGHIWSSNHQGAELNSYIDLALKTGGTTDKSKKKCNVKKIENTNLAKLNFRLKAVVGWASPVANKDSYLSTAAKRTAIDNSYVTLNLTPTVHDFDFSADGSVVLTINYLAYVDDYFDQNSYNIFADKDIFMASTIRELSLRTAKNNCDKATENYKEKLGEEVAKQKQQSIQHIVHSLLEQDLIKYAEYGYDKIRTFMSKGPFAEGASGRVPQVRSQTTADAKRAANAKALKEKYISKSGLSAASSDVKSQTVAALTVIDPNAVYIPFFYVGDLIDLVLINIRAAIAGTVNNLPEQVKKANKNKLKDVEHYGTIRYKIDDCYADLKKQELVRQYTNLLRLRVVLGPVEIVNHASKAAQVALQSKTVNFADLPISVKYFVEFLTEKMASKDRVVYPMAQFMNDFFNNLVRNFLNDDTCFLYPVKQKTIMNSSVLTAYRQNEGIFNQDPLTVIACKKKNKKGRARRVVDLAAAGGSLNLSGPANRTNGGLDKEINMLIYSAGRSQPSELMNGDRGEDHGRGVFHYQVGSRKGMIKDIKLSKTQTSGLSEVRFEQDGYDGLKQLRVIYDVEINTYAMPKAYPGVYIYVDPKGFHPGATTTEGDPMNLSEYGIGGYYMIYKSTHAFGSGQAESTLYAKWVAQLASAHSKQLTEAEVGDGEERNPTCKGQFLNGAIYR